MKRMKGVIGMRNIGLAIAFIALLAGDGWAQGSRPSAKTSGATTANMAGSTEIVESTGGRMLVRRHKSDSRTATLVEFMDAVGRKKGELRQNARMEGREIDRLLVPKMPKYVVSVERVRPDMDNSPDWPYQVARILDATGREMWRVEMCCDNGRFAEDRVARSEDGSVIAVLDVEEGKRECSAGERLYPAPPGCVGLRIFTAEGKEILREPKGKYPHLSPRGLSVVFHDGERNWLLNVKSQKREPLPRDVGRSVHGVSDEGIVLYYSDHGWNPPGAPRLRFVPGKGLEKLKD